MFQKRRSFALDSRLLPLANQSGSPQICNLWGERRLPSPNDVSVILCDRLAEREASSKLRQSRHIFVALTEGVFLFQKRRSFALDSRLLPLANQSGSPQICNLWGERRLPSPNDVSVILCDRLAERERPLNCDKVAIFLFKNMPLAPTLQAQKS